MFSLGPAPCSASAPPILDPAPRSSSRSAPLQGLLRPLPEGDPGSSPLGPGGRGGGAETHSRGASTRRLRLRFYLQTFLVSEQDELVREARVMKRKRAASPESGDFSHVGFRGVCGCRRVGSEAPRPPLGAPFWSVPHTPPPPQAAASWSAWQSRLTSGCLLLSLGLAALRRQPWGGSVCVPAGGRERVPGRRFGNASQSRCGCGWLGGHGGREG